MSSTRCICAGLVRVHINREGIMFIIQAAQDDGLSFGYFIANIPHDAPAIVGYVILIAFAAFIWWGTRSSGKRNADSESQKPEART
jgi:hypothetical protein